MEDWRIIVASDLNLDLDAFFAEIFYQGEFLVQVQTTRSVMWYSGCHEKTYLCAATFG